MSCVCGVVLSKILKSDPSELLNPSRMGYGFLKEDTSMHLVLLTGPQRGTQETNIFKKSKKNSQMVRLIVQLAYAPACAVSGQLPPDAPHRHDT